MEFGQLPNEILVYLFRYFDHNSLMKFLLTNHHNHDLIIANRKHFAVTKYRSIRICAGRKPTDQLWPLWGAELDRLPAPYSIQLINYYGCHLPITYYFDSPSKISVNNIQIRKEDQCISLLEKEKIVYCKNETDVKIFVYTMSPSKSLIAHLKKVLQYADVKNLIFDKFLISDNFLSSFLPIITDAPRLSIGTFQLKWCALYSVTPERFIEFFSTLSPTGLEVSVLCSTAPMIDIPRYFDESFWKTPQAKALQLVKLKNNEYALYCVHNGHPFLDRRLCHMIEGPGFAFEMKKFPSVLKTELLMVYRVEDIERNLEAWIDGEQSIVEWRLLAQTNGGVEMWTVLQRLKDQGRDLAPPNSSYLQLKNCKGEEVFIKYNSSIRARSRTLVVQKQRF